MWFITSGDEVASLPHPCYVYSACFTPTPTPHPPPSTPPSSHHYTLFTGAYDKIVRVWTLVPNRVQVQKCVIIHVHVHDVIHVLFIITYTCSCPIAFFRADELGFHCSMPIPQFSSIICMKTGIRDCTKTRRDKVGLPNVPCETVMVLVYYIVCTHVANSGTPLIRML